MPAEMRAASDEEQDPLISVFYHENGVFYNENGDHNTGPTSRDKKVTQGK